jgi:hypothetical protein
MRWLVAVLSLTVICSICGSIGALVLGKPSLKLLRSDRQVVSLNVRTSGVILAQGRPIGPSPKLADGR